MMFYHHISLTVLLCPSHLLPSTHQRCYNHPYGRRKKHICRLSWPTFFFPFLCVHVCWQLESRSVSLIIANDGYQLMRGILHARSRSIFGSHTHTHTKKETKRGGERKRDRGMSCARQEDCKYICETGRVDQSMWVYMNTYIFTDGWYLSRAVIYYG